MSQDFTDDVFDPNHDGQTDLLNIEKNFAALKSQFGGLTAPANPVAGMPWVDTTAHILKIRNEANSAWLSIFNLTTGVPVGVTPPFPAGTLMLFAQTTAPTGWTKSTTHNDKALRVVSGTAGSGGAVAFSTVFGRTATDGMSLSVAQMPAHTHSTNVFTTEGAGFGYYASGNPLMNAGNIQTSSAGSGASHAHNIDLRVNYVDVIIASKD